MIDAIIFDLDGVLLDSEPLWDRARREAADEHGGHWSPGATAAMQGMSSVEWATYMRETLGVQLGEGPLVDLVVDKLSAFYADRLPLLPGAVEAVTRLSRRWPLGMASSSNRAIIEQVLARAGVRDLFQASVSSDEVQHGKPAADVYTEAARRLGRAPSRCLVIEDSSNGIRAAVGAGMRVVALPDQSNRPPDEILSLADLVLDHLDELTVEILDDLDKRAAVDERLDEEELESFPASDPHSDWPGRST